MNELPSTAPFLPKLSDSKWERFSYFLPWLALVSGLLVTFGLWNNSRHTTEKEALDFFNTRVRETIDLTTHRLMVYEQVLRGVQGLFKASQSVDRADFNNYVASLKLTDNFPGIQGVGFSLIVSPGDKESHIASIRKEGFPEYTIWPDGKRDIYTTIIYLEPLAERNLRAFGYDMYSEPIRRQAMERARDSGDAALSGKVLLVQEGRKEIQAGFLIYLPVYRNDMPHGTLAQRRANIVGWVYSPFRTADLIRSIYSDHAPGLNIRLYDGGDISEQALMYDSSILFSDNRSVEPRFSVTRQLEIAGHRWTTVISSSPLFELNVDITHPKWIAAGGVIVSILLTLIFWILVNSRRRAVLLAQRVNGELIKSEQALRESEAKLQVILDSAAVAISWANAAGEIKYANRKFRALFGYTLEDVPTIEEWYRRAYPDADYRKNVVSKWEADITAAHQKGITIPSIELDITCKDGSIRHTILTSAWVDTDILVSFSDITELKQKEEKLQLWANIFEYAKWGIAIGDADGEKIELVNPAFAELHGYTTDEVLQISIAGLFAPQERANLPTYIQTAHEKGHYTFESLHLRKDGSTFPVLVDITAVKDAQGRVLYRIVNVQDITLRKQFEKALQESKAILQAMLDNLPYLVWMKDKSGRFIVINKPFLASTGRERAEDVLGKCDADLWPVAMAEKYRRDDEAVMAMRGQLTHEEQALHEGKLIWTETFKSPVLDESGMLLGVTGFARDITERKQEEIRVRHQAHHDALTELPNRTLFSDRLQQELVHAKRDRKQLAVMFIDLDQFKPVNDVFGHDVGDLLLKEVGQRLRACVRESDTVARIGGDEFCVLLSSIESGEAEHNVSTVAQKILRSLQQSFVLLGNRINIAASIGVAVYPQDGIDEQKLIKSADIAMYLAKEVGGGTVNFFNGSEANRTTSSRSESNIE